MSLITIEGLVPIAPVSVFLLVFPIPAVDLQGVVATIMAIVTINRDRGPLMSPTRNHPRRLVRPPYLWWATGILLGFSGLTSAISILQDSRITPVSLPELKQTSAARHTTNETPLSHLPLPLAPARDPSFAPPLATAPHSSREAPPSPPREIPNTENWQDVLKALPGACLAGMPELAPTEADPNPRMAPLPDLPPGSIAPASWLAPLDDPAPAPGVTPAPNPPQPVYRPRSDLASVEAFFNPHQEATRAGRVLDVDPASCGEDPHAAVFRDTPFPSALTCASCHRQIFEEWAVSSHAYSSISPMFVRFEDTLNRLSQGTVGYFCLRCHAPVATTMGLRRDQPLVDGPRVFREGVTCVACHRVTEQYGKVNGERRIEPGSIVEPVVGGGDGLGVERVLRERDRYLVRDTLEGAGQAMHRRAIRFEQLSRSDYCVSCHQVAVYPNIKLEVVWDQYVASPAYREGITCQDCHMGKVAGLAEGYSIGPCAILDGKPVLPERKHSNHLFYGPGYSVAHPGIFPHSEAADRWPVQDWLQFDWRSGWGTDAFEQALERGEIRCDFPAPWNDIEVRYEAREIIESNLRSLAYKRETRRQVMENGSRVDGPFFQDGCEQEGRRVVPLGEPLRLAYTVTNLNSGHNLPTASLGAQPQLWLNVVLVNPQGQRVWETGYLDSQGDLADLQSEDVLNGRLPHDDQLFNLQTKFLITNVKGTDREVYLPVNTDIDQIPFFRPAGLPVSVLNHPPLIRMEAHSLPPLGSRDARYRIPGDRLSVPGWYRLSVRLRSRAEPPYFMRFVESTPEMIRRMTEEILDCHPYTVSFEVQ